MAREPIFRRLLPYGKMPQTLLIGGFAGVILAGALALLLPWSQTKGEVGFVDALFTSTSAVCVTGLVVVDTGTAYTLFGHTVIVGLIQIGGLGIMTFASTVLQSEGKARCCAQFGDGWWAQRDDERGGPSRRGLHRDLGDRPRIAPPGAGASGSCAGTSTRFGSTVGVRGKGRCVWRKPTERKNGSDPS